MKKHLTLFLILLAPLVAQAQGGTFDFKNAPVAMILDVYAKLSARQLVIESGVTNQLKFVTVRSRKPVTNAEALQLMESALREQASVKIEPMDAKHLAVKLVKQ